MTSRNTVTKAEMMKPVASTCVPKPCKDVHDPDSDPDPDPAVRINKLKAWAESDAKFLKRLTIKQHEEKEGLFRIVNSERSESLDRLVFRQRYLRSYTFVDPNNIEEHKNTTIINKLLSKKKKKNKTSDKQSSFRYRFRFLFSCVGHVHIHHHHQ